jgi:hypothetical protein
MKPAEVKRTVCPLLPDIMDLDSLSLITHLEELEKEFILHSRTPRLQYLRTIYIKARSYFRHSRYAPGDLPRLMRLKMAEKLDLPKKVRQYPEDSSGGKKPAGRRCPGVFEHQTLYPTRPAKGRGLAGTGSCPAGKQYTGPDQRDHQLVQGCCHRYSPVRDRDHHGRKRVECRACPRHLQLFVYAKKFYQMLSLQ